MGNRKINIGFFTGYLMDPFGDLVCRGAIRAAEELDVNLTIFPGNYLDLNRQSGSGFYYEYQPNTLFSYADKKGIDALVACISAIGCLSTTEHRRELMESVKEIPIVTVASEEEGYASVVYDNRSGIRTAIRYMIEVQNVKKFGMITGPKDNEDFVQRYETFRDTLAEYHLSFSEEMLVYGDATAYCADKVEELLDRNPDLEAIVSANDAMALAVYEVCAKRGITIGKDLLVTGFDDVENSCKLSPPLASIRADASCLGYRAVHLAVELIKGGSIKTATVPTTFIPRESAGYKAEDIRTVLHNIFRVAPSQELYEAAAKSILKHLFYAQDGDFYSNQFYGSILLELQLLASLCEENCNSEKIQKKLKACFNKLVDDGIAEFADQHRILQLYVIALQELTMCNRWNRSVGLLNRTLSGQLNFLMDSVIHQSTVQKKQYSEILRKTNILSRDMLMNETLGEQSYQSIIANMQLLDINYSYLYLYETPIFHLFQEEWKRPKYMLLKAYQEKGTAHAVVRTKQKIASSNLLNNSFFKRSGRHTWVLLDLYICEWQYGVFVCDLNHKDYDLAELITNQISPAVKMINLFQKEQSAQKCLEETLEQLTLNNITLDRMSRFDELTGILNRRGFLEEAAELLRDASGKNVLVIYADLDSLKLINDLFGHDEGDFSLRCATQILSTVFYQEGVIGRIGGDEFAALTICESEEKQAQIKERFLVVEEDLNAGVNKPYRIQLSVGMDLITYSKGMLLNDMLSQADDMLYQKKRHKKNILIPDRIPELNDPKLKN